MSNNNEYEKEIAYLDDIQKRHEESQSNLQRDLQRVKDMDEIRTARLQLQKDTEDAKNAYDMFLKEKEVYQQQLQHLQQQGHQLQEAQNLQQQQSQYLQQQHVQLQQHVQQQQAQHLQQQHVQQQQAQHIQQQHVQQQQAQQQQAQHIQQQQDQPQVNLMNNNNNNNKPYSIIRNEKNIINDTDSMHTINLDGLSKTVNNVTNRNTVNNLTNRNTVSKTTHDSILFTVKQNKARVLSMQEIDKIITDLTRMNDSNVEEIIKKKERGLALTFLKNQVLKSQKQNRSAEKKIILKQTEMEKNLQHDEDEPALIIEARKKIAESLSTSDDDDVEIVEDQMQVSDNDEIEVELERCNKAKTIMLIKIRNDDLTIQLLKRIQEMYGIAPEVMEILKGNKKEPVGLLTPVKDIIASKLFLNVRLAGGGVDDSVDRNNPMWDFDFNFESICCVVPVASGRLIWNLNMSE